MKKRFIKISLVVIFITFFALSLLINSNAGAANTGSVTLSGDVVQYIALSITQGNTIAFGNISPGVPQCSAGSGTTIGVTTSASNGYTISLSDDSDIDSPMVHTDGTTYIPDMTAPLATPATWVTGTTKGLAVTMYESNSTKEAVWGTGITACDVNNKWSGVPAAATIGHDVDGYHEGEDMSSWGWMIDVPNDQKTGIYSGSVLFTSAAKLS